MRVWEEEGGDRRRHGDEGEQRRLRRGLRGAAQEAGPREPQAPRGERARPPSCSLQTGGGSIHGSPPFTAFLPSTLASPLPPPISAGSSIDLLSPLTVAPGSSAQDLGISEMSKSLLQAARLQKQNKVLAARTPIAARARASRASVATLS